MFYYSIGLAFSKHDTSFGLDYDKKSFLNSLQLIHTTDHCFFTIATAAAAHGYRTVYSHPHLTVGWRKKNNQNKSNLVSYPFLLMRKSII